MAREKCITATSDGKIYRNVPLYRRNVAKPTDGIPVP